MNKIKNISIKNFLEDQGIKPQLERQGYGMYQSPLRAESLASFKVDFNKNLWYDFGLGEGGSIIDLVMKLESCSVGEAITRLENQSSFSFHRNEPVKPVQASTTQITSVKPLQNTHLIEYLRSKRSISIDIAQEYCQEVHYTINGKPYYAIGFKSDLGGWELRNEYFKGGTSPKGVTTMTRSSPNCLLFEGFMDMLSYLTLKNSIKPSIDMIVLNSVNNLSKASDLLNNYQTVYCFLDNDEAGKKAVAQVQSLGINAIDHSAFYRNHKDLNDYLLHSRQQAEQKTVQTPKRKLRM